MKGETCRIKKHEAAPVAGVEEVSQLKQKGDVRNARRIMAYLVCFFYMYASARASLQANTTANVAYSSQQTLVQIAGMEHINIG